MVSRFACCKHVRMDEKVGDMLLSEVLMGMERIILRG